MKQLLLEILTWWNRETLSLRLYTWWRGEFVGEDEFANRYYRAPSRVPRSIRERRWAVYSGYAEPSSIPAAWHGWIHHTVDHPPTSRAYVARPWEKPHQPNLTGTPYAYRPPGSILLPEPRDTGEPHYEPWRPD